MAPTPAIATISGEAKPTAAKPVEAKPAEAPPAEPLAERSEPAQAAQPSADAAAKAKHERTAKKAKRKPRAKPVDDGDDTAVASDLDEAAASTSVRRRGRWAEREYDAYDGRGERRVTVIRRAEGPFRGGGLFGGLFGF